MRKPRLIRPHASATYHVVSRIVDRQMVIGQEEKEFFRHWMRRLETFCGVRVLTYCLMSNHFHILVRVPCKADEATLSVEQLRGFLPLLYRGRQLLEMRQELNNAEAAAEGGRGAWLDTVLSRYDARRFDLSSFLKDLKQRFSQWHNGRHGRCGHLWEGAFRSVLVEDGEEALLTMAAYIDLNPVRAGLCDDPKDYRWSGYGEAVGGAGNDRRQSRAGLSEMLQTTHFGMNRRVTWRNAGPRYRLLLYVQGEERDEDKATGTPRRKGVTREDLEAELDRGGELSIPETLRCRLRYFSEGQAIGCGNFVDQVFVENRARFGKRRSKGAREMPGGSWGGLKILCTPPQFK